MPSAFACAPPSVHLCIYTLLSTSCPNWPIDDCQYAHHWCAPHAPVPRASGIRPPSHAQQAVLCILAPAGVNPTHHAQDTSQPHWNYSCGQLPSLKTRITSSLRLGPEHPKEGGGVEVKAPSFWTWAWTSWYKLEVAPWAGTFVKHFPVTLLTWDYHLRILFRCHISLEASLLFVYKIILSQGKRKWLMLVGDQLRAVLSSLTEGNTWETNVSCLALSPSLETGIVTGLGSHFFPLPSFSSPLSNAGHLLVCRRAWDRNIVPKNHTLSSEAWPLVSFSVSKRIRPSRLVDVLGRSYIESWSRQRRHVKQNNLKNAN